MKQKVEQYWGNYLDVQEQIESQVEKEEKQNARAVKQIRDAKDKINQFANK
jgi:ATPase subunit of ABC transporter with duplicated ATPase domains